MPIKSLTDSGMWAAGPLSTHQAVHIRQYTSGSTHQTAVHNMLYTCVGSMSSSPSFCSYSYPRHLHLSFSSDSHVVSDSERRWSDHLHTLDVHPNSKAERSSLTISSSTSCSCTWLKPTWLKPLGAWGAAACWRSAEGQCTGCEGSGQLFTLCCAHTVHGMLSSGDTVVVPPLR